MKKSINLDCTIVITSYNTKKITDSCLTNARKSALYTEKKLNNTVTIAVLDNASTDGSVEMIKKNHPNVQLMVSHINTGYGKGNNILMKSAHTPYILLLNADAYLEEDSLVRALLYLEIHPDRDGIASKLLYPDGRFQASGGFLPTPLRSIRWALGLESLPFAQKVTKPFYQYQEDFYSRERAMEWIPPVFLLIRRRIYEKTHGFDETLFLYMEDVEWFQRIRQQGFSIWYDPAIKVIHLGGNSTSKLPSQALIQRHLEGLTYFHYKHYPKTADLVTKVIKWGMTLRSLLFWLTGKYELARTYRNVVDSL